MAKKRQQSQAKRQYIPRQTRKFQLRRDHPGDAHIAEILDYAKSQRREVTVIRNGVRLLWALENGNLDVLFELFPQYQSQFKPDAEELIQQFMAMLQSGVGAAAPVVPASRQLPARPELPRPLEPLPPAEYDDQASENFLNAFL
jgi:hypothetical protein